MKKNFIKAAVVIVGIASGINGANAQALTNGSKSESLKNEVDNRITSSVMKSVTVKEPISPRALKDFARSYKNVTAESWSKTKDGFSARFISDDITNTIFYDGKGNWAGSIKYYKEEKMPYEIRRLVKSTYFDYSIIYIQEVETLDTHSVPTYVICLEDSNNIKMVRVGAGEMEVWQQFHKTN